MNDPAAHPMLWGALSVSCWVAGLLFLRFWTLTHDRLFALFCAAFWVLGLNWLGLGLLTYTVESRHYVYLLRLIAFTLIIAAIVDKNRRAGRAGPRRPD